MKKKKICTIFTLAIIIQLLSVGGVLAFDSAGYTEKTAELKSMLAQCEDMGLECPYEEMYITVMEQFMSGEDLTNEAYVAQRMDELYTETKSALSSYIAEEKTPLSVPKYKTSDVKISGKKLTANTTWGERPVFFVGYGHFSAAENAMGIFSKLGANIIQREIGPWSVVYEAKKPYGWTVSQSAGAVVSTDFDTTYKRGSVSLRMETGSSDWIILSQSYKVKPNTTYTCKISVKADTANSLYIKPYSGHAGSRFADSSVLKTYSYTFTTGDETTTSLSITADNPVTAYIDNITIWESGSSENLINNGNFEKNKNRFGDNNEYIVITDNIENYYIPMLKKAKENNVTVDLLLSPHYFPTFVKDYYPDINIYHEQHKLIMDKYLETLIPLVKDEEALGFICLSNEPASDTSQISALLPEYRNVLLEKYGSLSEISSAHKKSYTSLEDITMPEDITETRAFYDWMDFNDDKFAQWHESLAKKVKELMPEAKVHSKIQDYLARDGSIEFERGRLKWGTDADKFADFSDLMGNDAHAYYTSSSRPVQGKMKWYDFLSSQKNAPVYNSEDHIIPDASTLYNEQMAGFSATDIFQGALHGRYADTIWAWERTTDTSSIYSGNIMQRPDVLARIGKASLDLNRLAYEITAFNEKKANVAVLYSNLERVYNKSFIGKMDKTYYACLYAGQKVKFITENHPEEIADYDVLIVPNIVHADEKLRNAVKKFVDAGKKVIWIDECFTKDEYDNSVTFAKENSISIGNGLKDTIFEAGEKRVKVSLADGSLCEGVEWNTAEYNGKILINICNYTSSDIGGLKITYNNKELKLRDLINDEDITNGFTAKSYVPMLISVSTEYETKISEASFDGNTVSISAKNNGTVSEDIKMSAKYYDQNGKFKRGGALGRLLSSGEVFEGEISFWAENGGTVRVELSDPFGILIDSKTFTVE